MANYAIKRLIQGLLLTVVVGFLAYSMLYMMPGDPVDTMTGMRVPPEKKAEMRAELGLDKPLLVQYGNWVKKIGSGDFGKSIITKQSIAETLKQRIPLTLKLCGISFLVEILFSVPLGLLAAYKKDKLIDRILMFFTSLSQVIPNFWLAMLLILLFSVKLQWLPLNGYDGATSFILPIAAMAFGGTAGLIRMTKTEVLDVYREKFVLTAYAKGLPGRAVVTKHVLRNSLILLVVMIFMSVPWIISGAVIIENIFVIPGMGSYMTNAIIGQDFPVVQACVLIITVLTVLCNLASDLITALMDPRIRIEITKGG